MRPLNEIIDRWSKTQSYTHNADELQRAVRHNGVSSPCIVGCRSVCWKVFLLFRHHSSEASWIQTLRDTRKAYGEQRDHLLRFIQHPEALGQLTVDPLADDPESPWNTVRQDEAVRAEIQQDVQRLPDDVNYHDPRMQAMILDILFMYCKLNPTRGGYRQGMHELLAPIVHVLEHDAVDTKRAKQAGQMDEKMLEMLDDAFLEHDAYALFSVIMESAQSFYEVTSNTANPETSSLSLRNQQSAIVERSKVIHETSLAKVDKELAHHLTTVEILPQIFLIRWIRLLFSREFPFDQFLVLWDTIFAVDPQLDLVNHICVAMLLRIRWQLLEADYSVCLQLLLKYPPPSEEQGPETFVEDAVYLRAHLNPSGGSTLIMKYSGKLPSDVPSTISPRPSTPVSRLNSFRQRVGVRSPMNNPARFLPQQSGVEALFHRGAKGILEQGEKLGITQAVRDAVGEIKKNMQDLNESRSTPREILHQEGGVRAVTAMEQKNKQLAAMLNETVANLKALAGTELDNKAKIAEGIEIAAAKVQFVQIYLEDPTMNLPSPPSPDPQENSGPDEGNISAQPAIREKQDTPQSQQVDKRPRKVLAESRKPAVTQKVQEPTRDPTPAHSLEPPTKQRPSRPAPIPTRSSLAQSSFSYMLEPDESSSKPKSPEQSRSPPVPQHRRKGNVSREKNAFLFGEEANEAGEGKASLESEDIFGMKRLPKEKDASG